MTLTNLIWLHQSKPPGKIQHRGTRTKQNAAMKQQEQYINTIRWKQEKNPTYVPNINPSSLGLLLIAIMCNHVWCHIVTVYIIKIFIINIVIKPLSFTIFPLNCICESHHSLQLCWRCRKLQVSVDSFTASQVITVCSAEDVPVSPRTSHAFGWNEGDFVFMLRQNGECRFFMHFSGSYKGSC